jgi:hypothetical protein
MRAKCEEVIQFLADLVLAERQDAQEKLWKNVLRFSFAR